MQELLIKISASIDTFFAYFYWADVWSICLLVLLAFLVINRQSHAILTKNIAYNKGFFKFRTEVYTDYEKNFFV